MDFTFTEEQEAVAEAAASVFAGMASSERVARIESTPERFDAELWAALAQANLLGLALPVEHGGSGLGIVEICQVLEAQGRAVAPVPLWATTVLGAMPIAHFGTPEQQARWLPGVVSGEVRLTAALNEMSAIASGGPGSVGLGQLGVHAVREARGWRLHGAALAVPQAHLASQVLVPAFTNAAVAGPEVAGPDAADPDGAGAAVEERRMRDNRIVVLLVDPHQDGVTLQRALVTDRQIHPHMEFEAVHVPDTQVVAGPDEGAAVVEWILDRARTGLCALALGVCEEAVRRAAAYLNERQQFGRPLSSFQGTMLRAADAYIDTEAIRVTLWQAAWRLDTGRPAAEAVAAANWWASEAGQRVVHATQHLHGGMGADVEYPIHRYFLWGKQIELMLGGPSSELSRLGSLIAERVRVSVDRTAS